MTCFIACYAECSGQTTCKTGAKEIVATAAKVIGGICTHGVVALIKIGKAACVKAADLAGSVVSQASGFCTSATSALPPETAQPLTEACVNVTGELVKLPAEVCDFVMTKACGLWINGVRTGQCTGTCCKTTVQSLHSLYSLSNRSTVSSCISRDTPALFRAYMSVYRRVLHSDCTATAQSRHLVNSQCLY